MRAAGTSAIERDPIAGGMCGTEGRYPHSGDTAVRVLFSLTFTVRGNGHSFAQLERLNRRLAHLILLDFRPPPAASEPGSRRGDPEPHRIGRRSPDGTSSPEPRMCAVGAAVTLAL